MRVTLDVSGSVAEARRIAAPMLAARQINPLIDKDAMSSVLAALAKASLEAVKQWRYEPPNDPPVSFDVTISFTGDGEAKVTAHGGLAATPFTSEPGTSAPTDIPVKKTKHVAPIYPVEAKEAGIQGTVVLEAAVSRDGHVLDVRIFKSVAGLDRAAVDAVKQWEFEPVPENDDAMPLTVTVTIQFTLP
jgi:TonB family protein